MIFNRIETSIQEVDSDYIYTDLSNQSENVDADFRLAHKNIDKLFGKPTRALVSLSQSIEELDPVGSGLGTVVRVSHVVIDVNGNRIFYLNTVSLGLGVRDAWSLRDISFTVPKSKQNDYQDVLLMDEDYVLVIEFPDEQS